MIVPPRFDNPPRAQTHYISTEEPPAAVIPCPSCGEWVEETVGVRLEVTPCPSCGDLPWKQRAATDGDTIPDQA